MDTKNLAGDIPAIMTDIGQRARAAATVLASASAERKHAALTGAAAALRDRRRAIEEANALDMEFGREKGLSDAMLDRLLLTNARIDAMADGLLAVAALRDPVGEVIAEWDRPNGLHIQRVRTPLGVIGVIYESRPNVTADAAGLCLKSGNAAILRGGSESFYSSAAILEALKDGLRAAKLPEDCVQSVPTRDREAVGFMLSSMAKWIDVIVPRGGKGLVERVQNDARVPVFAHLEGVCHVYVDAAADIGKAVKIAVNAKMRRTGICGAAECLLFDAAAPQHITHVVKALLDAGCEVRGDDVCRTKDSRIVPISDSDYGKEFLAPVIAAVAVDGVRGAVSHIRKYGSGHTEAIISENPAAIDSFTAEVDSAIVMVNASTQFADGGEFGMGAEIGIATGKMHARGPVGAEQLTSFKYIARGDGAVRG